MRKMDVTQIGTVLAIVVITYLIGLGVKSVSEIRDEAIPVIAGVCGGILGIVGMFAMPDFPANDILNAIAIGIVSGLASTGVNQVWKQAKKQ
jgi:ribonucleotide monophosphatase NagD (HAD superfamily)